MRYLIVDEDGQLHDRSATDYQAALDQLGPEGHDRVRLDPVHELAAYVNDCGFVMPDQLRRNVVASVLIIGMGGSHQPYAGPVIFTGWDNTPGLRVKIRSVADWQVTSMLAIHRAVRISLGLDAGDPDPGFAFMYDAEYSAWVRDLARQVMDAPTPGLQVFHDGDAIEALRSMRGDRS